MAQDDTKAVYAFCNICKENVQLDISGASGDKAESGLMIVLSAHGNPQHASTSELC